MSKKIGIGIMGLGTVGYGSAKILHDNNDLIVMRSGTSMELIRVLDKNIDAAKAKLLEIGYDDRILTDSFDDFIATEGLDIVVEVIGGTTIAFDFIKAALSAKKSVVTANKDLIAIRGKELFSIAEENGVDLLFEAAVAGGIPIIAALKHSLIGNKINKIMGIVNGTTNYILTKMYYEGTDFEPTLKEAQDLGYAEADPTSDVGGLDAARKMAILASIAYNSRVTYDDVFVEGIEKITSIDMECGSDLGYVIKIVGITREVDGEIEVRVHPVMISKEHPLASVNDVFNAVFVDGEEVGQTMFYGKGAGAMPTGSAIVGDIAAAAISIKNGTQGSMGCGCRMNKPIKSQDDVESKFFMRLDAKDQFGVLAQIASCLGKHEVSIASLVQKGKSVDGHIQLVIITHSVKEGQMKAAIEELESLAVVGGISSLIRVEDEM